VKKLMNFFMIFTIIILLIIFGINFYVKFSTKNQIIDLNEVEEVDAIVVLGASIREDGSLSLMLKERLDTSFEVYNKNNSKLVMTGDHTKKYYNEVTAMKNYAIENNIDSNVIYLDHAGISTYDSIYRMKHIFKLNKIIIVTQEYHLYRALYIANELGLDAVGVSAPKIYSGQGMRDIREILARNKDFVKVMFKPEPTYLGDTIQISGDGNVTVD